MMSDEHGDFMHVDVSRAFIRAASVPSAAAQAMKEFKAALKEAAINPDASDTVVEFTLEGSAYTQEELAVCDEIAKILLKLKPRHVKKLVFTMRHGRDLQAAERIVTGANIRKITLRREDYPPNSFTVAATEDGHAMDRMLSNKAVQKITFRGLVFAGDVYNDGLAASLVQSRARLTFDECAFLGDVDPFVKALAANTKLTVAKFTDMLLIQEAHDFTIKLLRTAWSSKLQCLTLCVPAWTKELELALAQFLEAKNCISTLSLNVPRNMIQHMEHPGRLLLQSIKKSFARTTLKLHEHRDPFQGPYLMEFASLFGRETGSLVYIYLRLNKAGRLRSICSSKCLVRIDSFATLGSVSYELDCLFVHLKEIPGFFGANALQPRAAATAALGSKPALAGDRKRKASSLSMEP
ncbi:hypothetical protein MPSEU_000076400 [Mayamaea pseudoterrestris]|nr:hypothetical protein MPSEU_000076400 [Mayamaea pseudoterrestris]